MIFNNINQYLHSGSRNKIVFFKEKQSEIPCFDVGFHLAKALEKLNSIKHISFRTEEILENMLNKAITEVEPFDRILCLTNLGILFEKDLKLNFRLILEEYSKDIPLFVHWEGQIENNALYFLSKAKGIKIDINDLSHITL